MSKYLKYQFEPHHHIVGEDDNTTGVVVLLVSPTPSTTLKLCTLTDQDNERGDGRVIADMQLSILRAIAGGGDTTPLPRVRWMIYMPVTAGTVVREGRITEKRLPSY